MKELQKKIRLDYLDVARAFAIIAVLFLHCINPIEEIPYWAKFFAAFNMPLFFTVCGITSHPREEFSVENFKSIIKDNAFSLLLPYFIWCLIYMPFNLDSMRRILYGSCEMFIQAETGNEQFWFLPCLFLTRIFMCGILVIDYLFHKHRTIIMYTLAAISFTIGFILPKLPNGYPWCVNIIFMALGFMIMSHLNANYLNGMNRKSIRLQVVLAISSGLLLFLGTYFGPTPKPGFMSMCTSDYGHPFWFLFNALTGVICVRSISTIISRIELSSRFIWLKKSLVWIGMNTMGIFIVHKPFGDKYIVGALSKALNLSRNDFRLAIIGVVAMLLFSIVITIFINAACPELIGKHRKKN